MDFILHIWRQAQGAPNGAFKTYQLSNISADDSFLEMLDVLNEQLIAAGEESIAFDFDCREGICGSCGLVINGHPHGKQELTTTCQLYMREYKEETELWIEPFRSSAMPVVKDLVVDRTAMDSIIRAGGYVSVGTGNAPDASSMLVAKEDADVAFAAAACIGCGACIAVCPNSSATLFLAAKVTHLNHLPQGQVENTSRVNAMLGAMDENGFGSCSNHKHCAEVCPKNISLDTIKTLNSSVIEQII